ncbi:tRNA uridine(34) 5-carboxymethylaminomethyl modification radical SAM/GNAT enzyme Elp3 [Candidatus Woesearchaeota archaeon]|nr:tRNA uridine(34) 5-carboxymethylaminomethyl modification radical SAM/GNAT enzyme Elp3 [Candidatus Woesearchaeota archaeon]
MHPFYEELLKNLKEKKHTEPELSKLKRDLSLKHRMKRIPTNIEILLNISEDEIDSVKAQLLTKPVRSISGVAPLAMMTAPAPCPHGKCTYCPGGPGSYFGDVPMSYTGKEPSTMRAIRNNYDPYLIVFNRLEQYLLLGHNFEKVEIIVQGGTFPAMEAEYQEDFVKYTYKALNDFGELFFNQDQFDYKKFKEFFELPMHSHLDKERTQRVQQRILQLKGTCTLLHEQQRNETAKIRCVAICIETKPDWGFLKHGNEMLKLGCTRVELGIQSVYDDVLKSVHRGHTAQDTIKSIQILKDLGLKITGHYMPGLPLTDKQRDIDGMNQLFTDENYRPDMLKLYPCMVSKGTALYYQFEQGKFTPISADEAAQRIVEFKKIVPEYCRIMRIQRDVPTKQWAAGVEMTNFRQFLFENYPVKCRCIRCREPMGRKVNWDAVLLKVLEYPASQGTEFFIAAEDPVNDILVGFVRLRFPAEFLREEITPASALIRELHVYGTATALADDGPVQHRGWGQKLMQKAEEIARNHGKNKIVVISGVGVREYYKNKLGYHKEGPYMVKML